MSYRVILLNALPLYSLTCVSNRAVTQSPTRKVFNFSTLSPKAVITSEFG